MLFEENITLIVWFYAKNVYMQWHSEITLKELHSTEEWREINLVITGVRNTHFIVYWYTEGNTDLQNCNIIVIVHVTGIFMHDFSCNTVISSTNIGVSGARSHRERGDTTVGNTITIFVLSILLRECYIMNCIGRLTLDIFFVYMYRVINDFLHLL